MNIMCVEGGTRTHKGTKNGVPAEESQFFLPHFDNPPDEDVLPGVYLDQLHPRHQLVGLSHPLVIYRLS